MRLRSYLALRRNSRHSSFFWGMLGPYFFLALNDVLTVCKLNVKKYYFSKVDVLHEKCLLIRQVWDKSIPSYYLSIITTLSCVQQEGCYTIGIAPNGRDTYALNIILWRQVGTQILTSTKLLVLYFHNVAAMNMGTKAIPKY